MRIVFCSGGSGGSVNLQLVALGPSTGILRASGGAGVANTWSAGASTGCCRR